MALIQVVTKPRAKNNFVVLDSQNCPDDGAYRVVGTSDSDNPVNVIVAGEDVIFFDNNGMQGIFQYTELDYSYTIEPCNCEVMFN